MEVITSLDNLLLSSKRSEYIGSLIEDDLRKLDRSEKSTIENYSNRTMVEKRLEHIKQTNLQTKKKG
jgi:hypothetical protein